MEKILDRVLEISVYASVITLTILLLKKMFGRRMSPALHYALWLILLARLVCPVTLESGFHLIPAVQSEAPAEAQSVFGAQASDIPEAGQGQALPDAAAPEILTAGEGAPAEPGAAPV